MGCCAVGIAASRAHTGRGNLSLSCIGRCNSQSVRPIVGMLRCQFNRNRRHKFNGCNVQILGGFCSHGEGNGIDTLLQGKGCNGNIGCGFRRPANCIHRTRMDSHAIGCAVEQYRGDRLCVIKGIAVGAAHFNNKRYLCGIRHSNVCCKGRTLCLLIECTICVMCGLLCPVTTIGKRSAAQRKGIILRNGEGIGFEIPELFHQGKGIFFRGHCGAVQSHPGHRNHKLAVKNSVGDTGQRMQNKILCPSPKNRLSRVGIGFSVHQNRAICRSFLPFPGFPLLRNTHMECDVGIIQGINASQKTDIELFAGGCSIGAELSL